MLTPAPPVELSTGAVVLSAGVGPLEVPVADAASVLEDGAVVVPVSLLVCGETSLVEAEAVSEVTGAGAGVGVLAETGTEGDSGAGTVMLEVEATVLSTLVVVVRPDAEPEP